MYAVAGDPGPCIQRYGNDLYLCSNSNVNTESWSNLGYFYKLPGYEYGDTQASEFLAGSCSLRTVEIEMYIKKK